ncbi:MULTISPECIES: DUF4192 family protein [unclassified Microbacterium]|uniref:DUF4192 family protein n=1 Tax=unclassified Microbacterium TaxID=2609290 RepID=UPI0034491FE1
MTTVLRASGSAEFLGIVPSLVGFTPVESLVLLPFHASRTTGAMRLDLPRDEIDLVEYADTAIALVARVERTDAVAVVVYTDDEPVRTPDGIVLPLAVEVEAVLGCAIDAGLRIVDALCVTPSGWAGYLDEEPELGDLDDLDGVAMPDMGDVSGDQVSGVGLPTVDLGRTERVGRTLRDITAMIDGAGGPELRDADPPTIGAVLLLKDIPALFESVLAAPEDLPAHAVAALLWCLDRPLFRDVALAQWGSDLAGGLRTLDAQLAFAASGARIPDDIGDVFLGRGAQPDTERLRRALLVARAAAASAPRASRPAPLTAAAWLSWALGRSSHAACYLELVRDIDPRYGLAELLDTMMSVAVLPEWAFRRATT